MPVNYDTHHDTDCDKILALMFCEFDNQEGPKILYQVDLIVLIFFSTKTIWG